MFCDKSYVLYAGFVRFSVVQNCLSTRPVLSDILNKASELTISAGH